MDVRFLCKRPAFAGPRLEQTQLSGVGTKVLADRFPTTKAEPSIGTDEHTFHLEWRFHTKLLVVRGWFLPTTAHER